METHEISVARNESAVKDYRVTVKVRNNRLLKAIEAVGGAPGQKWCGENGLCYTKVNALINMTSSPLTVKGSLFPDAARLCEVLDKLPEDLWSNDQLYPLEKNFSDLEMDYAHVVALLPTEQQSYLPDFSSIEQTQVKELIDRALSTLTPREERILRWRFFDELTLDECGERFNATREYIRQIEAKALRKLRHPKKAGILADAVDLDDFTRQLYKNAAAEELRGKQ